MYIQEALGVWSPWKLDWKVEKVTLLRFSLLFSTHVAVKISSRGTHEHSQTFKVQNHYAPWRSELKKKISRFETATQSLSNCIDFTLIVLNVNPTVSRVHLRCYSIYNNFYVCKFVKNCSKHCCSLFFYTICSKHSYISVLDDWNSIVFKYFIVASACNFQRCIRSFFLFYVFVDFAMGVLSAPVFFASIILAFQLICVDLAHKFVLYVCE